MLNEKFDDDLFRVYFSRIYRNLVQQESEFIDCLEESDKPFFISYSNSLNDMAKLFKINVNKDLSSKGVQQFGSENNNACNGKRMKRRIKDILMTKNIFGLGDAPIASDKEKTCRIVPTTMCGWSKVEVIEVSKPVMKLTREA